MSRYEEFAWRVSTQAELVEALRAHESAGGGSILLEGGVFTIARSVLPPEGYSGAALYLGDGASLEVRDGLFPPVHLTLPDEYVQSLYGASAAPRSLYWSSAVPPLDLESTSQNPGGYGDVTLYVPDDLLDLYSGRLSGGGLHHLARFRLELWDGYDLEPAVRSVTPDYVRESREARQGGTTYTLDDVEAVHAPGHYTWLGNSLAALGLSGAGNVEAWDVLDAAFPSNPHLWNCGKYLLRQGRKGGEGKRLEDLRKARQYLDRAIGALEGGKHV